MLILFFNIMEAGEKMIIVLSSAWDNILANRRFSLIIILGIALCTFICGTVAIYLLGSFLEPRALRDFVQTRTLQVSYAYLPGNTIGFDRGVGL